MKYNPLDKLFRSVIPVAYDDSISYYEMVSKVIEVMQQYIETSSISYADPIQWDITKQYPRNTVVVTVNGDGYLSTQPVPIGIDIDNEDYWTKIGNFSELWGSVKLAITPVDEGLKTTASANRNINDLVWLNNDLYVILKPMDAGTRYIEGTNCKKTDIGEQLNNLNTKVDTNKSSIDNSIEQINTNIENINTNLNKKIDKDTAGDLAQTVSGNLDVQSAKNVSLDGTAIYLRANGTTLMAIDSNKINIGSFLRETPVSLLSMPQFRAVSPVNIDNNYAYVTMRTGSGNVDTKFLVSRTGEIPSSIEPSPTSIEKYQKLKKDGTDDITATINTHTKNEPLFIPAGTYKVSAPLQLKHSLYGAGSSRDPRRGTSDTILQYTANPTAFGSQGVITVSDNDVTGNIVVAHLDIICNGMIGGVVFTTNVYTDNSLYDVSIYGVKSYGVYLNPTVSTLNRYCYVDHVSVWGYSDNTPKERWDGNVGFFVGDKAPDCYLNNVLAMVCQTGFDIRKNTFGTNWITFNGIPANGSGGTDANKWWDNTIGVKITNDDIHVTNLYIDTCRCGIVFDGPGKSAAYINNMIYTCEESTATTGNGYATIALIGTSPNPQFIVDGGIINRTSKVSTTIQSIGTYPVTNAVCKLNDVYIYTKREYIFGSGAVERGQYICAAGEHRCIDLAITNQMQYIVKGQNVTGNPKQYKAFAIIPVHNNKIAPTQGSIRIRDNDDIDITVYLSPNIYASNDFICAVNNRSLYKGIASITSEGTKNISYRLSTVGDGRIWYTKDEHAITLYCYRPASYDYVVTCEGFNNDISPVILDHIRNEDGTPMDYPRWDNNNGMTAINVLVPTIS